MSGGRECKPERWQGKKCFFKTATVAQFGQFVAIIVVALVDRRMGDRIVPPHHPDPVYLQYPLRNVYKALEEIAVSTKKKTEKNRPTSLEGGIPHPHGRQTGTSTRT